MVYNKQYCLLLFTKSSTQNRKLGKYPPAAITAGEVDDDDDGAFSLDVQETKPNVSKSVRWFLFSHSTLCA